MSIPLQQAENGQGQNDTQAFFLKAYRQEPDRHPLLRETTAHDESTWNALLSSNQLNVPACQERVMSLSNQPAKEHKSIVVLLNMLCHRRATLPFPDNESL